MKLLCNYYCYYYYHHYYHHVISLVYFVNVELQQNIMCLHDVALDRVPTPASQWP